MKLLLLGSGGREHAMAYQISKSPLCDHLYIAPGNAGTELCGENVILDIMDNEAIAKFCIDQEIDMLIVGPEAPLVNGVRDALRAKKALKNLKIIGPSEKAAMLEGSKSWAKEFMQKYKIPTAAYQSFNGAQVDEALVYLKDQNFPIVIKADGLAAGKGVIIAQNLEEAQNTVKDILQNNSFGDAGNMVVIEEFLDGIEMSCFVLTDGKKYYRLPSAKDYKRIGEGDKGPNTGGMGAISPVDFIDEKLDQKIVEKIINPTIKGLNQEGIEYIGFIFFGLINIKGEPFVIEYNARLGDPETEVILNRLENDFLELMDDCARGTIQDGKEKFSSKHCSTVMLVSQGYPGSYEKGKIIHGLGDIHDGFIYHAGTKKEANEVVTNGGRVIALTSLKDSLREALNLSYENAEIITFDGKSYRKDIGHEFLP